MRTALVAIALLIGVSAGHAQDVTNFGQPVCRDLDELQEAVLALAKRDGTWMRSLKSCVFTKAGMKLATIEQYGNDPNLRVAKVRLFFEGSSIVGYTLRAAP